MHGVVSPFPVHEALLCYFVAFLAKQGVAPSTIKTYHAAVRHAQIMRGLPEPRERSSLPHLRLMQSGVRRVRAERGTPTSRPRPPITPDILARMRAVWAPTLSEHNTAMLWAAAAACFFGFFRAGELTVPTQAAFDSAVHLA